MEKLKSLDPELKRLLVNLGSEQRSLLKWDLLGYLLTLKPKACAGAPIESVKLMLLYWKYDLLETDEGLGTLIEICKTLDSSKTAEILAKNGLSELAERIKG
ncbi:MAG: hypothetical protein DRN90_04660 [Thermoproteota archaeon]|nr:MAG: hypothetical protein DRN92_08270 [Candidatus Korarchaeota archaeon]RLG47647.1 MAG: hypothetical protein DRN90_04660 [Candidatus Korarchaeota archaeon]